MGVEPIVAIVAAIFGGVGLKIVESILNKSKEKFDLGARMRNELRDDVMTLKDELEKIEESLESWKQKYYELLNAFNELSVLAKASGLDEEVDKIRDRIY